MWYILHLFVEIIDLLSAKVLDDKIILGMWHWLCSAVASFSLLIHSNVELRMVKNVSRRQFLAFVLACRLRDRAAQKLAIRPAQTRGRVAV